MYFGFSKPYILFHLLKPRASGDAWSEMMETKYLMALSVLALVAVLSIAAAVRSDGDAADLQSKGMPGMGMGDMAAQCGKMMKGMDADQMQKMMQNMDEMHKRMHGDEAGYTGMDKMHEQMHGSGGMQKMMEGMMG